MPLHGARAQALLALLDSGDVDGAEAIAETLWAVDRGSFWGLLDEEVSRGRASLTLGLVLTRAVRNLPSPDLAALQRIFVQAVVRLAPERPGPEAQELLTCAALLRGERSEAPAPGWLLIGAGSAHLHHLNWLASQSDERDLGESLRAVTRLLTEAAEQALSPREHLQLASVFAHYAGLTGDARWLPAARRSLAEAARQYPALVPQWTLAILIKFAQATGDAALWREVVEGGMQLLAEAEPAEVEALIRHKRALEFAHYHLAIAYGHLGDRAIGLAHLAESVIFNPRRLHLAVADNDMAPLFNGAGSDDFLFVLPPDKQ